MTRRDPGFHPGPGDQPDQHTLIGDLRPQQLPAVEARIDRALHQLRSQPPVWRCAHLPGAPVVGVCAEHPAAGLLCTDCSDQHTGRHTWKVEHTCDVCGQVAETMTRVIGTAHGALPTIHSRGGPAIVAGAIHIVCLGVCTRCAEAADLGEVVVTR